MNADGVKLARVFRNLSENELADLLYEMAERHPDTFNELVMKDERVYYTIPGTNVRVSFSQDEHAELKAFPDYEKIRCIKRIREIAGVGLKEAKDISEAYFAKGGVDPKYSSTY
jgi:Ribosomal protein L7/L12 C-terminal domain